MGIYYVNLNTFWKYLILKITPKEVINIISNMKGSSAPGKDGLLITKLIKQK